MASLGMAKRQIVPEGATAEAFKGTRYERHLVGNRPEMARGLDSHGFHHLRVAKAHHLAMSRAAGLTRDDERSFDASRPKDLARALDRLWTVAPTPEQIQADIYDWPAVLDKIIEYKGRIVPEYDCRSGVRKAMSRRDPTRELKRRPRAEQKKSTMVPPVLHPDLATCPAVVDALKALRE